MKCSANSLGFAECWEYRTGHENAERTFERPAPVRGHEGASTPATDTTSVSHSNRPNSDYIVPYRSTRAISTRSPSVNFAS